MRFRIVVVAFAVLSAVGCGGGTSSPQPSPPTTPQTTVNGVVFASDAYASGVVNVYDFKSGVKGGFLATSAISGTGTYQLTVPASSGAILIEAASGCYAEKAIPWNALYYGTPLVSYAIMANVCSTSLMLSAAVTVPAAATTLVAAVTPYTHAAVGLAEYEIRNGSTTTNALADANARLSLWVGADILATLPTAPVRSSTLSGPTLYGSLLSGIPSWLMDVATTAPSVFGAGDLTSLAFADAMKSDLAQDGVLNGVGRDVNGNAVALVIGNAALSTTIYRHELALYAVIRVRAETEGALNSTSEEQARIVSFLPSFMAYNDATNSLLDASVLVTLDEGGPVITIMSPLPGATLTANQGMAGFVHDSVGILALNTVMLIDGVLYTPFLNQYVPNHFINTTVFANGPHTLTIQATNNLGHISTASVTATFFN